MTPAATLPQTGPPALHSDSELSSLPDETLLLAFNKLSIRDTVQCAAVCRRWRVLLRSNACWAGVPLRLALSKQTWDDESRTLKKEAHAIVDALHCRLACGLHHATDLEICSEAIDCVSSKRADALYAMAHSFFHRFSTASQPPLTIESLKLADIIPDQKLREALARHCQHVKALHFTFPLRFSQPPLTPLLEACPFLEEITLTCAIQNQVNVLTALQDIAAVAQSCSRRYRCVREDPSGRFQLSIADQADVTQLLPWFGSIHFEVRLPLHAPFTVPVPGIRCHVDVRGGASDIVPALSSHLHECQAAYHAIRGCDDSQCAPLLSSLASISSVREIRLFKSTTWMQLRAYPNLLTVTHDDISLEDLRIVSVACPNLSCLSCFVAEPIAETSATAASEAFPSFPNLTRLELTSSNIALANHIVSTSPKLIKLTLDCPCGFELLKAIDALPYLISLTIVPLEDSPNNGCDWPDDECSDITAATYARSPSADPCLGAPLKSLHLNISLAADNLDVDYRPLCTLLSNSSATLERLHLHVNHIECMRMAVDVLLAGRFARLRFANINVPPNDILQLSGRHPLCSWCSSHSRYIWCSNRTQFISGYTNQRHA